jgi:hypothetical protein
MIAVFTIIATSHTQRIANNVLKDYILIKIKELVFILNILIVTMNPTELSTFIEHHLIK